MDPGRTLEEIHTESLHRWLPIIHAAWVSPAEGGGPTCQMQHSDLSSWHPPCCPPPPHLAKCHTFAEDVLWLPLEPWWLGCSRLFVSRYSTSWAKTLLSRILLNIERRATGLQFLGSRSSPFLSKGTILAFFQSSGNTPCWWHVWGLVGCLEWPV